MYEATAAAAALFGIKLDGIAAADFMAPTLFTATQTHTIAPPVQKTCCELLSPVTSQSGLLRGKLHHLDPQLTTVQCAAYGFSST